MSAALSTATASLDGEPLDDRGIRDAELARAHHALAYLKERIGNAAMRDLLARDIDAMTKRVREWVEVLNPGDGGIEVVENIGETDLPWRIFYRDLPDDAFPMDWNADYPVRFGAEIVDGDGLRVGYTMHQGRDAADGMHLHMRTLLPEAAPQALVDRRLRHFAIEFTNWTRAAWLEAKESSA